MHSTRTRSGQVSHAQLLQKRGGKNECSTVRRRDFRSRMHSTYALLQLSLHAQCLGKSVTPNKGQRTLVESLNLGSHDLVAEGIGEARIM